MKSRKFSLVLGGGGMRGLAHIGVIQCLEEYGMFPQEIVGSSVGSIIAATWCAGMPVEEVREMAVALKRKDLFRVAHSDMAFKRMKAPALYMKEPLQNIVSGLLGNLTFKDLKHPLIVNTVDINSGAQIFWGTPGLRDVKVADAVTASCSLPGFLPPCEINGRFYIDGAAAANLPVRIAAARGRDLVIAVDVGSTGLMRAEVQDTGFAGIYARAQEIAIQTMKDTRLDQWTSPPMILLQPRIGDTSMFSFSQNEEFITEGYRAAEQVINSPEGIPAATETGIFPRRQVKVRVHEEHCTGCGACLIHGPPGLFVLNDKNKAEIVEPIQDWSPNDGGYLRQCPTYAIVAHTINGAESVRVPGLDDTSA
jgi:NTE family protein